MERKRLTESRYGRFSEDFRFYGGLQKIFSRICYRRKGNHKGRDAYAPLLLFYRIKRSEKLWSVCLTGTPAQIPSERKEKPQV